MSAADVFSKNLAGTTPAQQEREPVVWRGYQGSWQVMDYPFAEGTPSIGNDVPPVQVPYSKEYWREQYGGDTRPWQPTERGPAEYDESGTRIAGEYDPTETVTSAVGRFYNLSPEEMERLRDIARRLELDTDYGTLRKLWAQLVEDASDAYTLGGKKVSPWEMGEMLAEDYAEQVGLEEDGEEEGYYGPVTTTDTRYNFTDPASAAGMAYSRFADELGRRPNTRESRAFQRALHAYEQQNPVVTVRTVDPGPVDAEGNPLDPSVGPTTTSSSSGGTDPNAFAQSWILKEFGDQIQVRWAASQVGDIVDSLIGSGRV